MKRKICIVGPCLTMGGMERASSTMANSFDKHGWDVTYLAIFNHPKFFQVNPSVKFVEPDFGISTQSMNISKTLKYLRSEILAYDPELLLVYGKFYSSLVVLSLLGTNYPVFVSERSSPLFKWKLLQKLFMKLAFVLKKPAGVLAQTEIAKKYQSRYFKGIPIVVVNNSIRQIKHYPNLKRENAILAVGRLSDPLKGFDLLVRSYSQIKNKSWKLVFAGADSPEYLQTLCKELAIEDSVEFLGKQENIDAVYASFKLFVIPSRSEGFPNALCEAMAAGMACVSFDFIAGPSEIITNELNGLIVENGNIEKMSEAIDRLIEDEQLRVRLGEEAMNISEKLSEENIVQGIIQFFDKVLKQNDFCAIR